MSMTETRLNKIVREFHRVSSRLASLEQAEDIIDNVLTLLKDYYRLEGTYLFSKTRDRLHLKASISTPKRKPNTDSWKISSGLLKLCRTRDPIVFLTPSRTKSLRSEEKVFLKEFSSEILIPLRSKNQVHGILIFSKVHQHKSLIRKESHLIETFTNKLIQVINFEQINRRLDIVNRRLKYEKNKATQKLEFINRELKKRVYNLKNILEISNMIYSETIGDFERMSNSLLLAIIGQLRCRSALVILSENEVKQQLAVRFFKGFSQAEVEDIRFNKNEPLAQLLMKNRKPFGVSEIEFKDDSRYDIGRFSHIGLKIIAPIFLGDSLEGLIAIGSKINDEPMSENDMEIFSIMVNIVSISINNAMMYQQLKTLTYTDEKTKLSNYRYFEIRLSEEISRAKRIGGKLSLLILDIDNFKNYNDTLGHVAGDHLLVQLGKILKSSLRDIDIVSRYGGEEFSIILPDTDSNSCFLLAERIRKNVEKFEFENEKVQPSGDITVSIGGSTFPTDANLPQDLIVKADQAMYQSKKTGRNRVSLAREIE